MSPINSDNGLLRCKKARPRRSHRINDQRAIQKHIPCLAACFRDQQTAVARGAVQRSIVGRGHRIVVSAHWIAGAQVGALQGGFQDVHEPPGHLDEAT